MSKEFSNKITHINFILTLMIVILHSNCLRFIPQTNYFIVTSYKILIIFGDAAVPCFFCLSGYLFYRNYDLKKVKIKYLSRIFSLVIPYICWSIIFLFYYYLISLIPMVQTYFDSNFNLTFSNLFNNIIFANCAEGFWFIRNLIIYVLFSPFIYIIFKKNKFIDICMLILLIVINLYLKSAYSSLAFWLPTYLLGVYIALFYKDIEVRQSIYKSNSRFLTVTLFLLYIMLAYLLSDYSQNSSAYSLYRIFSPFILFYFFDNMNLQFFEIKKIETFSFLIYCLHLPVIKIVRKCLFILFGYNEYLSLVVFVLTIIISLIIIYFICKILYIKFPRMYSLLSGKRERKKINEKNY